MSQPPTLSDETLRRAPSLAALAALCAAILPGGRVGRVRRLRGGISSGMHAVDLHGADGARQSVVVRRYGEGRLRITPLVIEQEWSTLSALARAGVCAPRPIWRDPDGAVFGCPSIVTSKLPGHGTLAPRDPVSWVEQLAHALAEIHRVTCTEAELALLGDQHAELTEFLERDAPPQKLAVREGGTAVWLAMRRWWPRLHLASPRLIHGDYWPGNTLWRYGRLTGVIDWEQSGRGDPRQDVACCRLDLTLLIGPAAAETFLHAYETARGTPVDDLFFWDLYMSAWALDDVDVWVKGYQDLGRTDMTGASARAHLGTFVANALDRAEQAHSD